MMDWLFWQFSKGSTSKLNVGQTMMFLLDNNLYFMSLLTCGKAGVLLKVGTNTIESVRLNNIFLFVKL